MKDDPDWPVAAMDAHAIVRADGPPLVGFASTIPRTHKHKGLLRHWRIPARDCLGPLWALLLLGVIITGASAEPTRPPGPNEMPSSGLSEQGPAVSGQSAPPDSVGSYAGGTSAEVMLGVPISNLVPGNIASPPRPLNPVQGQSQAIQRGMTYFISFNCVGCHAPNGGGGMGPSLSDSNFTYGGEPANIYLSIYQGRPNGMPAWGAMLPDDVIWNIVAYVSSISKEPSKTWGQTISPEAINQEQVPSEYVQSTAPWGSTQKFSAGQKPNRAK